MKHSYYSYFKSYKIELPYIISGWLDTYGNLHKCGWGEHTEVAFDLIKEKGWYLEFRKCRSQWLSENSRDFLVKEKKFILLDNPTHNKKTQVIQYNPHCKHTKRQINKLLELFSYSNDMTKYIIETFMEN